MGEAGQGPFNRPMASMTWVNVCFMRRSAYGIVCSKSTSGLDDSATHILASDMAWPGLAAAGPTSALAPWLAVAFSPPPSFHGGGRGPGGHGGVEEARVGRLWGGLRILLPVMLGGNGKQSPQFQIEPALALFVWREPVGRTSTSRCKSVSWDDPISACEKKRGMRMGRPVSRTWPAPASGIEGYAFVQQQPRHAEEGMIPLLIITTAGTRPECGSRPSRGQP